ncbi:efflux RND transporter periplasmic adaptor subunit [Rubritalea tangerina]|uniref:Efflux RND transporter periplasmic adaptor subunit n=1 Tax=Rubritalea tangerina TaxID=430798 RepID=A0ABW4Z637_9BACT
MSEQHRVIRPLVKFIAMVVVLGLGFLVMGYFVNNPKKAQQNEREEIVPRVEWHMLKQEAYEVELSAQGQVEAVTQTVLVSEVGGAVEFLSSKLKTGGRFEKGELMLRVSAADYKAQLEQARANVADAELQLAQEEARAVQALRDWKKLGRGGEPSSLILREPQLKSAKARVVAAEASVVQAQRDLKRTEVKAPYACMVANAYVDAGGYLVRTGRIAEIYEADKVQVRMPMSLVDVTYFPETLVGSDVRVRAEVGRAVKDWKGKVVRTEGMIDRSTHTMMVVVEMLESDGVGMFKLPPIGLFVKGTFGGVEFDKAARLPRKALRSGDSVWVVSKESKLEVRSVRVERREREYVVLTDGFVDGDKVITSPIELPIEGMRVDPAVE